ncbi:sialate O-acetylesterase [Viscerimonas tarda]
MKANKQLLLMVAGFVTGMAIMPVALNGQVKSTDATPKVAIIVAGQSNAEGRVPYTEFPTSYVDEQGQTVNYLTNGEIPNTKYSNKNAAATFNTWKLGTANWAFDAIVLSRLQHLLNDVVYEIKWTQGGSAISPKGADTGGFWTSHFDEIPTGKNTYVKSFVTNVNTAIEKNQGVFDIKAFLWHQGEGDYQAVASADYYVNFRDLIAYVRTSVGKPDLPVIFGTISHKSTQYSAVVEAAQKKIAAEDDNIYLIDMQDALLLDPYHFNAVYAERLGKDAYEIIRDKILSSNNVESVAADKASVSVYPNPVKQYLYIDSTVQVNKVEIYSEAGGLLLADAEFAGKTDVSKLQDGVYLARIYTDNAVVIRKIIVRK